MLESRSYGGTLAVLLAVLALALGCYLYRSDVQPRQIWQKVTRFTAGQQISYNTAQYEQMQTEHFTIKYTPADDDYADIIADSAEQAYRQVNGKMKTNSPEKTTIIVYPDSESLAQCFGWDRNEKALGVYWAGSISILSPHQWLKEAYNENEFQTDGPLVHEYVHLIVDDMTKGNYNRWWTEGVAQYIEKRITGFQFEDPENVTADQLFTFAELDKNFDALDQQMSYFQARQAVEFIAARYGEDAIYAIMNGLSQGEELHRAIEQATGTDFENFAYQCYQYMEEH